MESFFHGKSSGLDPLNSYLSLPILINSKDHIEPAGIPSQLKDGKGAIFLLDSGKTGETVLLHHICHKEIHASLTEAELARDYHSIDALRQHPRIAKFINWIKKRPADFNSRVPNKRR